MKDTELARAWLLRAISNLEKAKVGKDEHFLRGSLF